MPGEALNIYMHFLSSIYVYTIYNFYFHLYIHMYTVYILYSVCSHLDLGSVNCIPYNP